MTITLDWTMVAALLLWTMLAFWLGRKSAGAGPRDLSGPPPQMRAPRSPMQGAKPPLDGLSPGRLEAIRGALAGGNKIMAIKLYRDATGAGLAEAKAAVEAMEQ